VIDLERRFAGADCHRDAPGRRDERGEPDQRLLAGRDVQGSREGDRFEARRAG
jgi:hypothetical protein